MLLAASLPLTLETNYFAVTAINTNCLESEFSNEVMFVRTNYVRAVTLAWDASPSPNVTYLVYRGPAIRSYTNSYPAGTNLTLTIWLKPPPMTNVVVTVTTTSATNLLRSSSLGPLAIWNSLGKTNWMATNPPSPLFFRALGRNSTVTIRSRMQ
jgi:hypothetical protein